MDKYSGEDNVSTDTERERTAKTWGEKFSNFQGSNTVPNSQSCAVFYCAVVAHLFKVKKEAVAAEHIFPQCCSTEESRTDHANTDEQRTSSIGRPVVRILTNKVHHVKDGGVRPTQ